MPRAVQRATAADVPYSMSSGCATTHSTRWKDSSGRAGNVMPAILPEPLPAGMDRPAKRCRRAGRGRRRDGGPHVPEGPAGCRVRWRGTARGHEKGRAMNIRRLAIMAAAPVLILALGAGAGAALHGGRAHTVGTVTSTARAGYEAVANGSTVTSLQYVQATFTVPSLNCTKTPAAYSAQTVVLAAASFRRFVSNQAATQIVESCQNGSPA